VEDSKGKRVNAAENDLYAKVEALECQVDCEEGQMSATPRRSLPQPLSKRGASERVRSGQCHPRRAERLVIFSTQKIKK
jgi:hypothetical protein